jgi:hypothetical protein
MPLIPFPNVPNVPGVPALPRLPSGSALASTGLGLLQGVLWSVLKGGSKWGIYDSKGNALGIPSQFVGVLGNITSALGVNSAPGGIAGSALSALGLTSSASTNSIEYDKCMRVSDFPVERGGFASYNKVEMPSTPVVSLCYDGNESARTAFLNAIDKAVKSTKLYNVVTPEVTYIGYTIERYNYQRRAERGTTLLIVELFLKEVRQVSAHYTAATVVAPNPVVAPKNPDATPSVSNGITQAAAPAQSTLSKIYGKVSSFISAGPGF